MSQPDDRGAPPPRGGGGGGNPLTRKYGGVPGYAWVAIVSLIAGVAIWYVQKRRASSATNPAAGGSAQGPTQATCYDANGSVVACSDPLAVGSNATDYFEALYAQTQGINSQLENIGPQVTETGMDADTTQALLQQLAGSESTEEGGPGAGGGIGAVRNLQVAVISPTIARVTWQPPLRRAAPPGYGKAPLVAYTIEIQGKDKGPHNIGGRTSYNVSGLKAGGHYTAVVAPVGGPSASRPFTMPKAGSQPQEQPGGPIIYPPKAA